MPPQEQTAVGELDYFPIELVAIAIGVPEQDLVAQVGLRHQTSAMDTGDKGIPFESEVVHPEDEGIRLEFEMQFH